MSSFFLTFFIGISLGYAFGWVRAHITVAKECERLGKFFVGKKVFECIKISEIDDEESSFDREPLVTNKF